MDKLIYLIYPALVLLLFYDGRLFRAGTFNYGYLSLKQIKAFQGFCALCIVLHHTSQRSCAPWLAESVRHTGLEPFLNIGYLAVAFFLFCSGFGLYTSLRTKEDYFDDFFMRRIFPVFSAGTISGLFFLILRDVFEVYIPVPFFFVPGEPDTINPYIWYIYAIIYLYILFFLGFRNNHSDRYGIAVVFLGTLLIFCLDDIMMHGVWWYNTLFAFLYGIVFAKYKYVITEHFKKYYTFLLVSSFILTLLFFVLGNKLDDVLIWLKIPYCYEKCRWLSLFSQMLSAFTAIVFILLLGMKVSIGNRALTFLSGITLELYLAHGIFVHIFSFSFIAPQGGRLIYIKSLPLYTVAVMICGILTALVFKKLLSFISDSDCIYRFFHRLGSRFKRNRKRLLIASCALLLFISVKYLINIGRFNEAMEKYSKCLTTVSINGNKCSAYISGNGKHNIVFIPEIEEVSPVITLKAFADKLADSGCTVIVPEPPGRAYSEAVDTGYDSEANAAFLHSLLETLEISPPYILVGHNTSGTVMDEFSRMFRSETEALVGIDTLCASAAQSAMELQNYSSPAELERGIYTRLRMRRDIQRLSDFLGLTIQSSTANVEQKYKGLTMLAKEAYKGAYEKCAFSTAMVKEYSELVNSAQKLEKYRYPRKMPVLLFLSDDSFYKQSGIASNWQAQHFYMITNPDNQKIIRLKMCSNYPYQAYQYLSEEIDSFIKNIIE